jgi:quercetin dioxygenase-like cupin family protein
MNASRWAALFVVFGLTAAAVAQVPLTKDPSHTVTFENAQFRVIDVNIAAGQTSLEHRHELDIATVSMSDSDSRIQVTGQPWGAPRKRTMGEVNVTEYSGKPLNHKIENTGRNPFQLFAVENLKKGGWSNGAPATGLSTTMTKEGRAFRVYDVLLPLSTPQTSHTHLVPTIAILVRGKVMSDGPDKQAKANAPAAVGLKQLDQPGQWVLIPAGDTHHLVRLGTTDARIVEIEVR